MSVALKTDAAIVSFLAFTADKVHDVYMEKPFTVNCISQVTFTLQNICDFTCSLMKYGIEPGFNLPFLEKRLRNEWSDIFIYDHSDSCFRVNPDFVKDLSPEDLDYREEIVIRFARLIHVALNEYDPDVLHLLKIID
jgi:hypothetical protein